jgi:arylsulfatase A-like enzyme
MVAAGFAAILSSCSPAAKAPPPNVILITIDTLRADRLGCYGNTQVETPTMDALARDGVLFESAIAQVPLTTPSHAAILTGTYPIWNGMRDWSDPALRPGVPTLAEVFKRQGYTTAAFVSAFVLDSMWGLNRGFDHYDDWFKAQDYTHAKRQSIERSADQTVDRAIAWLQSRRPGPFFLWVHL